MKKGFLIEVLLILGFLLSIVRVGISQTATINITEASTNLSKDGQICIEIDGVDL